MRTRYVSMVNGQYSVIGYNHVKKEGNYGFEI